MFSEVSGGWAPPPVTPPLGLRHVLCGSPTGATDTPRAPPEFHLLPSSQAPAGSSLWASRDPLPSRKLAFTQPPTLEELPESRGGGFRNNLSLLRDSLPSASNYLISSLHRAFVVVQSLSRVRVFAIPCTTARQASLSITNSWSLLKCMSTKSAMPSNHLILCHPLLLPPSVFAQHQGLLQ